MARARNTIGSAQVSITLPERAREILQALTNDGLYGKNVSETASSLLLDRIREVVRAGEIAEMRKATDEALGL